MQLLYSTVHYCSDSVLAAVVPGQMSVPALAAVVPDRMSVPA